MPRSNAAQKIQECAAMLFARHGFTGTIMDELAELAGVNKATIYYHFKDKEALYEKVLVDHLSDLADTIISQVEREKSPLEKLDAFIMTFALQNAKRSVMTSIMVREIAGGGDSMPDAAKTQMHKILIRLKSIITQGVEEKVFTACNPVVIHFMIIGSLSLYITSEPMRKKMSSPDAEVKDAFVNSTIEEVAQQISHMVLTALRRKG